MAEVGRAVDVPRRQQMYKYATGERKAPPELIVKVETLTDGAVRASDWVFHSESSEPIAGAA